MRSSASAAFGYLSYDARMPICSSRSSHGATLNGPPFSRRTKHLENGEWNQVFPNAACIVTLVDRLVYRSEIFAIADDSYRLKETQDPAAQRSSKCATTMKAHQCWRKCAMFDCTPKSGRHFGRVSYAVNHRQDAQLPLVWALERSAYRRMAAGAGRGLSLPAGR